MRDVLHQNQRAIFLPGMSETIASALKAGAYGAALSGSGPTLIALINESSQNEVSQSMISTLRQYGVNAQAIVLEIDACGATSSFT